MLKKAAAFTMIFAAFSFLFCARAVSAKAYAMVDQASGRLICGQNTTLRLPMASTTKIMTALLACESGKLDKTVTVNPEALRVEGSSMGLVPDERITLRELVYGLMLESGNDAANAIAYYLGGSIPGFANMMNKRANQLGLYDTHYMNPSGLDAAGHYTTALDLARLGAYAMKNPDFAKIAGTKKIKVSYNGTKNGRTLVNHNKLLFSLDDVTGIKTGFTKKCGRCLVTSATKDGVSLVVATLKDPDDWDDHEQLFDYGFTLLKSYPLLDEPGNLSEQVVGGVNDTVQAVYDSNVRAALTDSEAGQVKMKIDMPAFIYAPVKKGQKIGTLTFTVNGVMVASTDIKAANAVAQQNQGLIGQTGGIGKTAVIVFPVVIGCAAAYLIYRRFSGRRPETTEFVRRLKE